MAAENIDSDQYVDGSIDEAHIANDAVNFATHLKAGTDGELITWDASGNPAAVPVGTDTHVLTSGGTGVAPTFQAASGGDVRNFIIDGDFTQWPEGTAATAMTTSGTYAAGHPALWQTFESTDGTATVERSTDVPTVAQSGHQSSYSWLSKCTGTDLSFAAGQHVGIRHFITGSDYAHLHSQQVTLSFWCKTAAANSGDTYYVHMNNSAENRTYCTSFTATSSWVKITKTITLDSSGTWLFTEADRGIVIGINLGHGSTFNDATENAWQGTFEFGASSPAVSNFLDSTSNEFYISQVQLVLGSTAPTFLSPPVATVRDQIDYYVQRFNFDGSTDQAINGANVISTSRMDTHFQWRRRLRVVPSVTTAGASTFGGYDGSGGAAAIGSSILLYNPSFHAVATRLTQAGTTWTAGRAGYIYRDGTDTCFIMADARH
jgi:hypothetical protein